MSFRRDKPDRDADARWAHWIEAHRETLRGIGLPPETYLSREHWQEFLERGDVSPHLHPGEASGFYFKQLSREQMQQLLTFLRKHGLSAGGAAPLLGFLEASLGGEQAG